MAHLGDVSIRNGQFCATIDKTEAGMRFKMFGPCREDKQHAVRDLAYIRAAATGAPTRLDELRAMKLATKILQDEAKAATRGGIESIGPDRVAARIRFEDPAEPKIAGPPRRTERRAKADLAKLRQAAQGHVTVKESIAAMRQKSRDLHQEAEFEANVAMGFAQYGLVRDAHKVVDSDPESDGPAPVELE